MASKYVYTIYVNRGKNDGTVSFECGSIKVWTKCWWDLTKPIMAKTYLGCSATNMTDAGKEKKREAIYIPNTPGYDGIFIHKGTSPKWSKGCIVIPNNELLTIWKAIEPKNAANVIVVVADNTAAPLPYDERECVNGRR